MRPSYSLAELLPHRPPMVLIDELVDFDPETYQLEAVVVIRPEWSGSWVAIEYMAQTTAALVGLHDRLSDDPNPSSPGFLLGTRRLELDLPSFEVGRRYRVRAKLEFSDDEAASFRCEIRDGDRTVARAMLNAFRPHDLRSFLESQRV